MVQDYDGRLDEISMDEAPETTSFTYKGKCVIEEWAYLPLEKRQRDTYVKPDVPYYHVAFQPVSYRITDGGMEGDNLEHTYAAIKTAQGELTPKGSARDELVKAFTKLGFKRNTNKELRENSAVGKMFTVKRYNRMYKRSDKEEPIRGELMNVPMDTLPDDWAPAPGSVIPEYNRAPRQRSTTNAPVASGSVARPTAVTLETVAKAIDGVTATEQAVREFVLDRSDLAQGEILDAALTKVLMSKILDAGLAMVQDGKLTVATHVA